MTLNTAIVSERGPIHGEPMEIDGIGPFSELPMDIVRIIFQAQKADLPAIALVCKKWKALADDEGFRQMIRPTQAFGTKEWEKYIGVEVKAEPRLPRRAYGDLERERGFLTFIPEKVNITKENGVIEEVVLDNLEAIGNLVKKPKAGFKTGYGSCYTFDPWETVVTEKIKQEKPHWVWIKNEVLGNKDETFSQQQEIAKEENKKIPGTKVSELIDTVITLFMEYVRYGKRHFIWDPNTTHTQWVRVNSRWGKSLFFSPEGLRVHHMYGHVGKNVGFVLARRFFGT